MERGKSGFDGRFRLYWRQYLFQSMLAAFSVFVVALALRQQNLVVAASLASSAFTVFTMPSSVTASMRSVIGGQLIGLLFGMGLVLFPQEGVLLQDGMGALAVGGAMFMMAVTNTEHPPAAGTALGVVLDGFSWELVVGVVVGVMLLSGIHRLLRPVLRDLIPESGRAQAGALPGDLQGTDAGLPPQPYSRPR